ncbi:MAG: hypothetical protein QXS54_12695 [Candidatus Methanomethylicaceae archaeon]
MPRFREEVINVQFASLLNKYGLKANPETIKRGGRPDVIVNMGGLKLIIEGKFSNRDTLEKEVKERIELGLADISIGLFYPEDLREANNLDDLKEKIEKTLYDGIVCYFGSNGLIMEEFNGKTFSNVVEILNHIFYLYVRNDLIREQVKKVERSIESIAKIASQSGVFFQSEALIERLRQTLGIRYEKKYKK